MKYLGKLMTMMLIVVFSISGIPAKYDAQAASEDQWDVIKDRGELRVGLSADYAPMEFERTVNGEREYAGIDIELAKKIAKDNGVKLKSSICSLIVCLVH